MKNHNLAKFAVVAGAMLLAGTASAVNTLAVTANIASECAVSGNAPIAFGTLSTLSGAGPSTTNSVAAGSMDAVCTNGSGSPQFQYTSANALATSTFRMVGADTTTYIVYTLHQDATATLGPVTYDTPAAHPNFSANGAVQTLNLSGRILPADKNGKARQTYSDTITITVSFT